MEKLFEGWLILNWKNKQMRVIKKKPKNIGAFEIPILLRIKVKIPERVDIKAEGEIEVPLPKLKEMVIEEL